ncbi:MAG TPA: hypothetical protein VGQ83_09785 [Polyangia bacterium]|jgi:DNA-binding NarL/FixJ family response regulator
MRDERQAAWVADGDEPCSGILAQVLRGLGFRLGVALLEEPPPDVLLVAVERGHVILRLAVARERARGAPVIAVLPTSDGELARRAIAAGADAYYACDTSLTRLRETVLVLLGLKPARARERRAA